MEPFINDVGKFAYFLKKVSKMFVPLTNEFSNTPLQKGEENQGFYEVGILFKEFCSQKIFHEEFLSKFYEKRFPRGYVYFALKETLPGTILYYSKNSWLWIYREMSFFIEISTTEIDQASRVIEFTIPIKRLDGIYKKSDTCFVHSLFIVLIEGYVDGIYCLTEHFRTDEVWLQRIWENGLNKVKKLHTYHYSQRINDLIPIFMDECETLLDSVIEKEPDLSYTKESIKKHEESYKETNGNPPRKEIVPSLLVVVIWTAAVGVFLSMFMKGCTNTLAGKGFNYGTDDVGSTFAGIIVVFAILFLLMYLLMKRASKKEN